MEEHKLSTSILLHLLPGAAAVALFILLSWGLGGAAALPPYFILMIALAVVLIPMECSIIIRHARKSRGNPSAAATIPWLKNISWWETVLYGAIAFFWAVFIFLTIGNPVNDFMRERIFAWMPGWFDLGAYIRSPEVYSRGIRIATWILGLIFGSFIGPAVEELYFRGYLLPRISRFKVWAPVIGTVLMALYHFWSPWMIPVRVLAMLPLVYLVWWRKNVWIGIAAHCVLNLVGDSIFAIPAVFGA